MPPALQVANGNIPNLQMLFGNMFNLIISFGNTFNFGKRFPTWAFTQKTTGNFDKFDCWIVFLPALAGENKAAVHALSSGIVFQEKSARYRAVEPEQWLQRHPDAGSSWSIWPQASHTPCRLPFRSLTVFNVPFKTVKVALTVLNVRSKADLPSPRRRPIVQGYLAHKKTYPLRTPL
jgi:hypothetical protein